MFKIILTLLAVIGMGSLYHLYTAKEKSSLISRKTLFEAPDRIEATLSPGGKWLSYIAPENGILNIWVQDLSTGKSKALTHEPKRGIHEYGWAYDNQHILYKKDQDGDENWQLYKVNINTGVSTLLTPEKNVHTLILKTSHLHPNTVLIGLNDRDPVHHDIYAIDLTTGTKTLVLKNTEFMKFLINDELKIVLAHKMNAQGEMLYYKPTPQGTWTLYRKVSLEDAITTGPLITDSTGEWAYWMDSEGSDKTNLVKISLKTKERIILAKGKQSDISDVFFHPVTKEALSVQEEYFRKTLTPLTSEMEQHLKILQAIDTGGINIESTTEDGTKWIVAFIDDHQPVRYYLYDCTTQKATFLFYHRAKWVGLPFVEIKPLEIKSRDGLTLVSYLSVPRDAKPGIPLPMILQVHGGPLWRDGWDVYSSNWRYHQWFSNRGYAVLSVNYRGSTGFGKAFIQAHYGEYGRKMHHDLIDAVNWAIKEGIADPKKIAIYGGSYGGYAALVGATMTPDVFSCAVDIVGMSSMVTSTLSENMPAHWQTEYEWYKKTIGGDPNTEKGKAFLHSRSPIAYIENIKNPLLIMQGANDPVVKRMESDQIVEVMQRKGIPVTYIMFPDEGHGFARPVNRIAEAAITEAFLHQNLGGALEPLSNEIKNSTAQLLAGKI